MSDIRFNQWLHNSGTGGVSQVDGGHVGIGTTNPLIPVGSGNTSILNVGVVTANSFYGDASNLTVSNGLVISGVTTVTTLDVNGTSDFSGDAVFNSDVDIVDAIVHVGDTDTKIRFPAADTISFETAGSEVLSMNLDGLVTGGQTNPTSSDNGNIYIKNGSSIGGVGHAVNYVSNAVFNGAWKYINSGTGATRIVVNQNGFQFDGAGSGTAGNNITFNPALNISSAGGHKITCTASHFSANLSEMNTGSLALNIIKSRQGQTKGIGFGAIGSSSSNTGIQAYDTSNNSANPLLINPFGGKICIGCPDNGTADAGLNVEDSTNNSTNTLKLINKPSGANGKARLEFYTETSAGQGCSPYIMSTSGTDAFGSNSANDGGLQFHTRHGGSGTDVNALELSNKGHVLKPNQPLFVVQKSAAITGTGFVVFNTVIENVGSHYDSSNGRFTAPVAGYYWFCIKINAYRRIDFFLKRNGANSPNTHREIGQFNTSDQNGWYSHNLIRIFELAANDYVQVDVTNLTQNTDPNEWITFQGYLLQ